MLITEMAKRSVHYSCNKTVPDEHGTLVAEYEVIGHKLNEMLQEYEDRMSRPYLMGKDLIEAGVLPGPVFTYALEYAHKLRLAGVSKDEQLSQTLGMIRKQPGNEG